MILVVMGVSGSGKSTVGKMVAEQLGWEFRDGDDFHPAANVEKMRAGTPLTDDDRMPWLQAIQAWMRATQAAGGNGVVACSALKEVYRDLLLRGEPWVRFVHLSGPKEVIADRMKARAGHFMPAKLLDSQFAALEAPSDAWVEDIRDEPGTIVGRVVSRIRAA